MAVFMGLTSPLVAGTQFTGYMALKNLAYAYSSAWQGRWADLHGYAATLFLDGWITFLPLLTLPFLRPSRLGRGPADPGDASRAGVATAATGAVPPPGPAGPEGAP
jgi:hypothetical protein